MNLYPRFFARLVPLLLTAAIWSANAEESLSNIPISEATNLAREAAKTYGDVDLERYGAAFKGSGFYQFEMITPNPNYNAIVGHLAVNSVTGDVWNVAGHCSVLTSLKLNEMQKRIRKRLKVRDDDYARLRSIKPSCDAD